MHEATTLPMLSHVEAGPRILKLREDSPPDSPPPACSAAVAHVRQAFAENRPFLAELRRAGHSFAEISEIMLAAKSDAATTSATVMTSAPRAKQARELIDRLLAEGKTPAKVADLLNAEGWMTTGARRWTKHAVFRAASEEARGLVKQRPKFARPKRSNETERLKDDPTEEQIEARCRQIQARWSKVEFAHRARGFSRLVGDMAGAAAPFTIPEVSLRDVRRAVCA